MKRGRYSSRPPEDIFDMRVEFRKSFRCFSAPFDDRFFSDSCVRSFALKVSPGNGSFDLAFGETGFGEDFSLISGSSASSVSIPISWR